MCYNVTHERQRCSHTLLSRIPLSRADRSRDDESHNMEISDGTVYIHWQRMVSDTNIFWSYHMTSEEVLKFFIVILGFILIQVIRLLIKSIDSQEAILQLTAFTVIYIFLTFLWTL